MTLVLGANGQHECRKMDSYPLSSLELNLVVATPSHRQTLAASGWPLSLFPLLYSFSSLFRPSLLLRSVSFLLLKSVFICLSNTTYLLLCLSFSFNPPSLYRACYGKHPPWLRPNAEPHQHIFHPLYRCQHLSARFWYGSSRCTPTRGFSLPFLFFLFSPLFSRDLL